MLLVRVPYSRGVLPGKRLVGRRTVGANTTLIDAVETAFRTTDHSDQTIADNITATGLSTTHNQIKEIRGGDEPIMAINWLR